MTGAERAQLVLVVESMESAIARDDRTSKLKPGQRWAVRETVEASLPVLRLLLREAVDADEQQPQ